MADENLELGSHTWDLAAGWRQEITGDVLRGPHGTWLRLSPECCFVTHVVLSDDEVAHVREAWSNVVAENGHPSTMQVERINGDIVVAFAYPAPPQTQWAARPPIGNRRHRCRCHVKQKGR